MNLTCTLPGAEHVRTPVAVPFDELTVHGHGVGPEAIAAGTDDSRWTRAARATMLTGRRSVVRAVTFANEAGHAARPDWAGGGAQFLRLCGWGSRERQRPVRLEGLLRSRHS
jgi:hypothetical protein